MDRRPPDLGGSPFSRLVLGLFLVQRCSILLTGDHGVLRGFASAVDRLEEPITR